LERRGGPLRRVSEDSESDRGSEAARPRPPGREDSKPGLDEGAKESPVLRKGLESIGP
jgi:hypothetical protein